MQPTFRGFFLGLPRFSRSLPFVLGALAACSSMPDIPGAESEPDLASAPDLGEPPKVIACRPTVATRLPMPVAELHAATPLAIEMKSAEESESPRTR